MRNKGFSLIELMVTIAIAGIITATAVPSFNTTIERNRILSERDELAGHLRLARSAAAANNGTVVVCASSDKANCNKTGDWESGWIVFLKGGPDIDKFVTATDTLLKVSEGIDDNNSLSWDGGGSEVAFDADGSARSSGTFIFCGSSSGSLLARALILYGTGSMRPGIDNDDDGVREDMDGNNISC
ncbi:hypothetical protein A9Q81_04870 [Gammaproteobacteria bacterium 42_54_T18]|nr:hypothetical protein A9Q81_04870 [Gammaproteobacteria bacterium 42_54_T18]